MTHRNVLGFETLMVGLCTNYKSVQGPRMEYKRALGKSGSTRVWRIAWLKKVWRKRVMKKKMKKLWQKRMYKLWQKKS